MKTNWRYWLGVFLLAAGLIAGCGKESVPQTGETQGMESQETEGSQETETVEEDKRSQETETVEEDKRSQETEAVEEDKGSQEAETIQETEEELEGAPIEVQVLEDGSYTSKEEVAEYIAVYGHLPGNFITKKEAKALGWVSSEGNLGEVAPGKSIGGDYFGNFEGNLPEKKGREYHECDIDSDGGYRGAKRIVYSNDGLIYYTEDHYETFELLYGEE